MDDILLITLISEGSKVVSELIRAHQSRSRVQPEVQWPVIPDHLPGFGTPRQLAPAAVLELPPASVSSSVEYAPVQSLTGEKVATSCVGCAIGHLATCAGLLKEAVRFANEGMDSPNILSRLNTCLDELNAMERVDLQPAKIIELPEWEKELARLALQTSRETRHFIEAGITSGEQLEKLAAFLTTNREKIGSAWLQQKLRALSKDDKAEIQRRVMAKLEALGQEG